LLVLAQTLPLVARQGGPYHRAHEIVRRLWSGRSDEACRRPRRRPL